MGQYFIRYDTVFHGVSFKAVEFGAQSFKNPEHSMRQLSILHIQSSEIGNFARRRHRFSSPAVLFDAELALCTVYRRNVLAVVASLLDFDFFFWIRTTCEVKEMAANA